jgi:hypothetical protein
LSALMARSKLALTSLETGDTDDTAGASAVLCEKARGHSANDKTAARRGWDLEGVFMEPPFYSPAPCSTLQRQDRAAGCLTCLKVFVGLLHVFQRIPLPDMDFDLAASDHVK